MRELPTPLKDLLNDPVDPLLPQRVWRRMADDQKKRALRAPRVLIASAVVVIIAVIALIFRPESDEHAELRLASGALPEVLAVPENTGPEAHDFADGTRVILMPDTRLSALANGSTEIMLLLERGSATFEVAMTEPRRWTVECGLATIEVLGGRFFVERKGENLRVLVEEGAVLVRGERVPNRVQRLTRGVSLELAPTPPPLQVEEEPVPAESSVRRRILAALEPRPRPRARVEEEAPAPLEEVTPPIEEAPPPIEEAPPPIEDAGPAPKTDASTLMVAADRARLNKDYPAAAELLATIIRDHPNDPRSPVAAFMLGRVELENLARARDAAVSFELALSLDLPRALREVALAHLADAHDRAGAHDRARDAAARYLAEYPQGQRVEAMVRIRDGR